MLLLAGIDNKQLFQFYQYSSSLQYQLNMFFTTC